MEWIVNKALKESGRLKTKERWNIEITNALNAITDHSKLTRLLQQVVDGAKFLIYRTDDLQRFPVVDAATQSYIKLEDLETIENIFDLLNT